MKKFIYVMFMSAICSIGCNKFSDVEKAVEVLQEKYPEDNFVEEILEDVLEHETGIDVDFSFNSPE